MKYRNAAIIFFVAFVLQTTIFGQLPIAGVSANLLLSCCIAISFACNENNAGVYMSAIFGLLYDICFLQYVGITAVCLAFIAVCCVIIREFFLNSENTMSMLVVSAGSIIIYYNLYWLIYRITGIQYTYLYMLKKLPLYLILNIIIIMLIYYMIMRKVIKHKADRYSAWGGY